MAARRIQDKSTRLIAKQALNLANRVNAAKERKYCIEVYERAAISSGGAVFILNATDPDTGDVAQRIGDAIHCVQITFLMQFVLPPTLTGSHAIRMVLIEDKQNTLANAGELFIGVGSNHCPMLQYTKDYRLSYRILYDSGPLNLDTYNPSLCRQRSQPLKVRTRYLQASATITTGALKAVFISDMPGSSPTYPSVSGTIRVDYTDS